jgi:hypothetical protein
MSRRDALVKAYIGALDIQGVTILAGPGGLSAKVGMDIAPDLYPFDTLWFAKSQHAELVLAQCPDGWTNIRPEELRDHVVNAAAVLGASFRTATEVEADAADAVAEIIAQVETMRQSGGLTKVNRDYKIYRQTQIARGQRAVSYTEHLDAFTRSLVVLAAQNSAAR